MAVESKIVYRSDASEVERDTRKLIRARTELSKLQTTGASGGTGAGGATAGRLQLIREHGAQRRFLQEQRIGGAREARQDRAREQHASRMASLKREEMRNEGRLAVIKARQDALAKRRTTAGPTITRAQPNQPGRESLTGALGMAGIAPVAAAGLAIAGAASFGKAVADAQAFRESTVLAMKAYLGSAQAANTWFDRALALSIELKQNSFDTIEGMTRLRGAGFDNKSVENLTRAFADIKRLAPDADLKSIAIRLAQIRATGKLQGDELNELANAWPAARDVIFKQMMKDTGKTMKELQEMQRAGKITPDMVERALLGGVAALTKMPLGEFAKANADTVRGLIDQVMAIPSQVLLGFDASKDMASVKGVMKSIVEFFDASSATGKEARTVISDVFSALVQGFLGVEKNQFDPKMTLQGILDTLKNSKEDIKAWAQGMGLIARSIASLIIIIGKLKSAEKGGDESFLPAWLKMIPAFFIIGRLLDAIITRRSQIGEFFASIPSAIGGFFVSMFSAGANLIEGLIQGIKSKVVGVADAARGAATAAVGAVTGFLGIKSPSTVAAEIGRDFDRGYAIGLERFAWMPQQAANDVAMGSAEQVHPTLGAATMVNNASATHNFAPVNSPQIVVGAGASPEAVRAAYEAQAEADAEWDRQMARWATRQANSA